MSRVLPAVSAMLLLLQAATAGVEAVRITRTVEEGAYVIKVVEGASGIIFDAGKAAGFDEDENVRLERGGNALGNTLALSPPIIEVIYLFHGIDAALQCRFRAVLDAIVGTNPKRASAYADRSNRLCPEQDIRHAQDPWPMIVDMNGGYSRRLVIDVTDGAQSDTGATGEGVWRRLALSAGDIDRKYKIVRDVRRFLLTNGVGFFAWLPRSVIDDGQPVRFSVVKGEVPQISVTVGPEGGLLAGLSRVGGGWAVAGAAGLLIVGIVAVVVRRARRRPERRLVVGCGAGYDVDLGEGEPGEIIHLEIFGNKGIRLVPVSGRRSITVNGAEVKGKTWLRPSDELRIDNRRIVFN